jgi:hypothetical protein
LTEEELSVSIAITLDPHTCEFSRGDLKTVFHRLGLAESWLRVGWWVLGAIPFSVRALVACRWAGSGCT